jgi:hypothetical protein
LRLLVVFVPRMSNTPVDTWFWQTEGRSMERVILGVRPSEFIWLEFQSPSRRIFIGSHSLPPSLVPNRSFNWYQSRFRSLLTLASLRSKEGVPGTGFRSSPLFGHLVHPSLSGSSRTVRHVPGDCSLRGIPAARTRPLEGQLLTFARSPESTRGLLPNHR